MPRPALAALAAGALLGLALVAGCGGSESKEAEVTLGSTAPATDGAPKAGENATARPPRRSEAGAVRPPIRQRRIPFGQRRQEETAAYAERHYGVSTTKLDPKVIVEHVSVTPTAKAVYETFKADREDPELHELPGVCSHFVIDRDGT